MLNLLRSDFYRLFRSKSYYICMLVEALLTILGIVIIYFTSKLNSTIASVLPKDGISYGMNAFYGGDVTMLLGIVIGIFVTAEFTHGTMKNVVSKGFSKVQIYLSKLITMVVAAYIFLLVIMLVCTIGAACVSGKFGTFHLENFQIMGIEFLLYAALTSLLLLFSMIVKNLGGVIAINIVYVLLVERLVFTLLQLIAKDKIEFTKYSLLNNIAFYASDKITGSDYLRSAIIAVVVIAVTTAIGIFAFKKSDVK